MNARSALERLDAVRPGSDDLSLPEMAGLGDALTNDPALAAEYRRRQAWDRAVAVSMHDVAVPEGAKERLLERLAASGQLAAYKHPGFWQPMDTLREKNYLEDLWESGKAPWKLWR